MTVTVNEPGRRVIQLCLKCTGGPQRLVAKECLECHQPKDVI